MKAKVFIGSSVESLEIAYAIQQNLEYDCNPTVWTQGIFQLSGNTLDDLLRALNDFDFGIFVFRPDDILKIRGSSYNTIRDNVVFELGLFIGKLGKERVYFVIPKNADDLHLPTDLLGVTPGKYESDRDDNNLLAALGPFCNQVRVKLKEFIYESLTGLSDESKEVKIIASTKPKYWEYLLAAELLKGKLSKISESFEELRRGLVFIRSNPINNFDEFSKWFKSALKDLMNLVNVLSNTLVEEFVQAFGEPGKPGSVSEIKIATDRIVFVAKELLAWEQKLLSIEFEHELIEVKKYMKGWTETIFHEIAKMPLELEMLVKMHIETGTSKPLDIRIPGLANHEEVLKIIEDYRKSLE